jgi:hypothetical protein
MAVSSGGDLDGLLKLEPHLVAPLVEKEAWEANPVEENELVTTSAFLHSASFSRKIHKQCMLIKYK